jgi:hypothetical protein
MPCGVVTVWVQLDEFLSSTWSRGSSSQAASRRRASRVRWVGVMVGGGDGMWGEFRGGVPGLADLRGAGEEALVGQRRSRHRLDGSPCGRWGGPTPRSPGHGGRRRRVDREDHGLPGHAFETDGSPQGVEKSRVSSRGPSRGTSGRGVGVRTPPLAWRTMQRRRSRRPGDVHRLRGGSHPRSTFGGFCSARGGWL